MRPSRKASSSIALPNGSAMIGKYRLIAMLGQGGMARVYLALMTGPGGFNKLLVVKAMKEDLDDPVFLRSFMAEARLAAQLNHPNVVQTYEVGEADGTYFIAMEYLEGQSLRILQRRLAPQRIPLPMQMRVLADVARGLHHAHVLKSFDGTALNIVHRDVSPQNVLITYDGQVKLLDFGIAKAHGSDDLTRTGMIKGKVDYMAPEQLRGDVVDRRADVFPLGAMMWEAITGMRFSGGAEVADATKIHNRVLGKERKLRDVTPDAPMRLVEICEKALALEKEDRHDSCEELAREIDDYLADTSRTSDGRRLSDIIQPLFERERREIRAVIDEQVRIANDPALRASQTKLAEIASVPSLELTNISPDDPGRTGSVRSVIRVPRPEGDEATEKGGAGIVRIALVVGLAAVVGVVAAMRTQAPAEAPQQAQTAPSAAPAAPTQPAQPQAAETISVRISASPSDATATLDGATINLPFDARLARDGHLHRLVVSAPDHQDDVRAVVFSRDVSLLVSLERSRTASTGGGGRPRPSNNDAPAPVAAQPTAPAPQPTATPTPTPTPTADPVAMRPPRSIDREDPYQQQ